MIDDPVHPTPLRPPQVSVIAVDHTDPAAHALRRALAAEMTYRYADRLAELATDPRAPRATPGAVAYTGLAITGDGLPIGHVALLARGDCPPEPPEMDLELKGMYVVPAYRDTGVADALLRAAEDAARALGARRISLQTGDRQPDAVRLYERAGYAPFPVFPPQEDLSFSWCYQKALR